MAETMGWQAKLAFDATSSFDTSSEPIVFVAEDMRQVLGRIESPGIRGSRSERGERVSRGLKQVGGSITLHPSPSELDLILPRILGANESTDSFALDDTLPDFSVLIDRIAKVFQYDACKIASAVFSGQSGQKVQLVLNILGKTETIGNAGTFPALTTDTDEAYVFHQGTLSLGGTSYNFRSFQLTIDNMITPEFNNSQTATDLTPRGRMVTLDVSLPFTSTEVGILTTSVAASTGIAGVLTFTSGNKSLVATMNSLIAEDRTPVVAGKDQELNLERSYKAYQTGSTKEAVFTNDPTA